MYLLLAVFLIVGGVAGLPLGGFFYMVTAMVVVTLGAIPRIGGFFHFVLCDLLAMPPILKLVGWFVSSSGLLLAYLLYRQLVGPISSPAEAWTMAVISLAFGARALERILSFKAFDHEEYLEAAMKLPIMRWQFRGMELGPEQRAELLAKNFADLQFTSLLHLLVASGTALFALGHLGFVSTSSGAPPTIWECMLAALSAGDLGLTETPAITGAAWQVLKLVLGIVLLVWIVAFVALALDELQRIRGRAELRWLPSELAGDSGSPTNHGVSAQVDHQASPPHQESSGKAKSTLAKRRQTDVSPVSKQSPESKSRRRDPKSGSEVSISGAATKARPRQVSRRKKAKPGPQNDMVP